MSHIINVADELSGFGNIAHHSPFDGTTIVILKTNSNEVYSGQQFDGPCSTIVIDGDVMRSTVASSTDVNSTKVTTVRIKQDLDNSTAGDENKGLKQNEKEQDIAAELISSSIKDVDQCSEVRKLSTSKKSGRVSASKEQAISSAISNNEKQKQSKAALSTGKMKKTVHCDFSKSFKSDKSFISSNPYFFTTSCAPDASSFDFLCQSCLIVRFALYEDLRSHEDWCGRRMQSGAGVSCLNCGLRYKNLVLLYRHALEVHSSGKQNVVPSSANPYNFSTVCAMDAENFPHVCASCKTVCFPCHEDMQLHESWCGQITPNECANFPRWEPNYNSDVTLKKKECASLSQPISSLEVTVERANDIMPIAVKRSPSVDFSSSSAPAAELEVSGQGTRSNLKISSVYSLKSNSVQYSSPGDKVKPSPTLIRCLDCCSGFENRQLLSAHKKFCANFLSEEDKLKLSSYLIRCLDCGCGFETRLLLSQHKKTCIKVNHRGRNSRKTRAIVECPTQDVPVAKKKCFGNETRLIQNLYQKSICCLNCNKRFNTRLLMEQHKRSGMCGMKAGMLVDMHSEHSSIQAKYIQKGDNVVVSKTSMKIRNSVRLKRNRCSVKAAASVERNWKLRVLYTSAAKRGYKRSRETKNKLTKTPSIKFKTECEQNVIEQSCFNEVIVHSKTDTTFDGNGLNLKSVIMNNASALSNIKCHQFPEEMTTEKDGLRGTRCLAENLRMDETAVTNASKAITPEFQTGESAAELEQAGMLRSLNLVPTGCLISHSKEVVPKYARQRRRKCVMNRFDPSEFRKPARKASVEPGSIEEVQSDPLGLPVSMEHLVVEVKVDESKTKNSSRLRESCCENVNKCDNTPAVMKRKSLSVLSMPRSLRTLEVVGEKAVRCARCGKLLKTIRQIVAHMCQA